ncbi:hypothetical protein FIA58_006900, partial [Flavobacterium jejuense]
MKKTTLMCFIILVFCFQSYAQFTENFDTNTTLPAGWSIINQGGANGWTIYDQGTGAHSGTNIVRIQYNTTAHDDYLISPAINVTSGVNDRISFYIKSLNSGFLEPYEVLLSTTTNTASSDFSVVLQSSQLASAADWEKKEFILTSYAGQTVYIAIRATGTDQDRLAVDDFVNDTAPSCPQPTVLTTNAILSTSAELGWTENGTASLYNVEVVTSGTPATGTATDTGVNNSFNKTGLTPATTYDYYVQADCGGGDLSLWSGPYTFTTACVAVDSFNENFDGVTTPALPPCWSKLIDNGASTYATVTTSTSADNTAPNGVTLYNDSSSSTANIMLISPLLSNLSDGTNQLRFFARAGTASQDIEVGTITNPADGSTFTPLTTVDLSTNHTEYIVLFDTYFGLDSYVAVRRLSTSTYTSVYLDDMVWEPIPSCPKPSILTTSTILATSAELGWTENGTATLYNVEVVTSGTPATGTATDTGVSNPFNKTGLTPATTYDYYVQADCGGGDLSLWSGPYTFTTACVAVDSFNENFDGVTTPALPTCWSKLIDNGASTYATVTTSTSADNTAPNGVTLYNSDSPSTANIMLISPLLSNLSDGTHQLRFFARAGTASQDIEVGTITNPTDGSTFTSLTTVDLSTTHTEYIVTFNTYSGLDSYVAVRRLSTSTYTDVYLDDMIWEPMPSCPKPSILTTNAILATSAELGWTENGTASLYNVEVVTSGTPATGTATDTGVSNPFNKTGLTPATTYDYYVQADCGGGDLSLWSGPYTFTTACVAVDSFNENFDGVTTPALPTCWSKLIDNGASTYATVTTSTSADNTAPNGVALYNSDSPSTANIILISPLLSNLSDGTHQLRFFARAGTASQDIEVGTITNPADGSTFTSLATVDLSTTHTEYIVRFDTYFGLDSYIAVRRLSTSTYTYVYLDDMAWETIPACQDPIGLAVSNLTDTSGDITWSATSGSYEYVLDTNTADPVGSGTALTTETYNATGLTSSTTYYFHVRTDCGSG